MPWFGANGLLPGRGARGPGRGMPWLGANGLFPGRGPPGRGAPGRGPPEASDSADVAAGASVTGSACAAGALGATTAASG
jgi:hypothetical protein